MRRLLSVMVLASLPTSICLCQSIETKSDDYGVAVESSLSDDSSLKRAILLEDLHGLEIRATKIEKALALAIAKAEIAQAAWVLDEEWAKKLLRDAFELTLPEEEERAKLRNRPLGTPPTIPTENERARSIVRSRILTIASHDKDFTGELVLLAAKQLGRYEEHQRYSSLAAKAIESGETEAAGNYILQSIEADPTQGNAADAILEIAVKDRATADNLIIKYIERLRMIQLSMRNQSAIRTYFILTNIVFTNHHYNPKYQRIPPAGPSVIKAYISYVLESLNKLEQSEPGSARSFRNLLLSTWLPLNQYAPELITTFFELERISRVAGETSSLPQADGEDTRNVRYEERVKKALESRQPDDLTIHFAISREDFNIARKMIDLLPDGEQKTRLTELVNMQEAISLAIRKDITGAERLAERLNEAVSILQVYPVIIEKCTSKKDQSCVTTLTYTAMNQLKRATDEWAIPLSLCRLSKSIAPVNETLALEVLEEAVLAANRSKEDTGLGQTGLDVDVFRVMASKNEARTLQVATTLKDPLKQIVALAAIYQWKATELIKNAKAVSQNKKANID